MGIERIEKSSEQIERNLLFCLCSDYNNYNKIRRYLSESDFHTDEFREVFRSIRSLYDNSGFKNIDKSSVESYCVDKQISIESMNRLSSFVELGRDLNLDFDGIYNIFRRTNGMLNLNREALKHGGYENMFLNLYDASETADDFRDAITDIARKSLKVYKNAVVIKSLASGMVDFVKNRMFSDDGRSIHFMRKPLLQTYSKGIHVGVTFVLGQSGSGKTSLTIPFFSIPMLESGQKLLSIHNEQEEDEIRNLYLMSYISQVKNQTQGLHRSNFNYDGKDHVSEEQMNYLIECAEEFEKRYDDRIMFFFVPRFNPDDLENIVVEHKRMGYDNVLLDTFKQEDSGNGWEGLDNLAKRMDGISKEFGMKIVCTAQLAGHMAWRKYLTVSCVGKAKSIKEVATGMYMFRWLSPEEIPTIKVSYYVKNNETGKIEWKNDLDLEQYRIDKNGNKQPRKYIAFFNDKQRKSEDGQVIIYEADLGTLFFKERGVTNSIANDDNGR